MDNKFELQLRLSSDIYKESSIVLDKFLAKWPNLHSNVQFDYSKALELNKNGIYMSKLNGTETNHNSRITITVHAIGREEDACDISYYVMVVMSPVSMYLFNNSETQPLDVYNKFYEMASFLGFDQSGKGLSTVEFNFDENNDIEKICINVKNCNPNTSITCHRIYDKKSLNLLIDEQINTCTNRQYLSDFYFLWQNTNIRQLLDSDNFKESFLMYLSNRESYHDIIKMERI